MRRTPDGLPDVYAVTPVPWAFDCAFPVDLRGPIRRAVSYVSLAVGPGVMGRESPCVDRPDFTGVTFVLLEREFRGDTWGMAPREMSSGVELERDVILMGPWAESGSDALREDVARHELGHVLGLEHSSDQGCLMFPVRSRDRDDVPRTFCERELRLLRGMYPR